MSRWLKGKLLPSEMRRRHLERVLGLPTGWLDQTEVPDEVPQAGLSLAGRVGMSGTLRAELIKKGEEPQDAGWLFGDPREAEEAFRDYIRAAPFTASRAMIGDPADLPPDFVKTYRLNQIELARISCRLGGRRIPDFIHQVENEIIEGIFR